jgi:hypothetical protein
MEKGDKQRRQESRCDGHGRLTWREGDTRQAVCG